MSHSGFRKAGHPRSLIAALVHFDVSFMIWVLLGALGAYIAADLHLSAFQKGLMIAVPPLGGACFRLILGPLSDRVGIKRLGLTTLALTAVPLILGATMARSFAGVLGVGLLLGIAGASFAVALPLASRWYPPQYQGMALGIAGAGNSGTVISALAAPRLAERVGWHGVFALALIPLAIAWIVFFVLAAEPPRAPAGSKVGLFSLFKEKDARWLCGFYAVTFGTFVGLSGYLAIFFVDRFGLTKVTGASFAALCAVAGSLLRPVGGSLADRFGGTRILTAVLATASLLAIGLATLPVLPITVASLAVMLGGLGMGNGAVFQLVGVRMPSRVGAMTGLVGAAGGLGGFSLPFLFGWLRGRTGGFATGFELLAVVAVVAVVAAYSRDRLWSKTPSTSAVPA